MKHLKVQKIKLNKQTISNLDAKAQDAVRGGITLETVCTCRTLDYSNCIQCPTVVQRTCDCY
jgi:hypothetical protein